MGVVRGQENLYIYIHLCIFVSRGVKMQSKNITLRVNSELYTKYREFCKKKGLLISRQVEIMMEEQLKKEGARK